MEMHDVRHALLSQFISQGVPFGKALLLARDGSLFVETGFVAYEKAKSIKSGKTK